MQKISLAPEQFFVSPTWFFSSLVSVCFDISGPTSHFSQNTKVFSSFPFYLEDRLLAFSGAQQEGKRVLISLNSRYQNLWGFFLPQEL